MSTKDGPLIKGLNAAAARVASWGAKISGIGSAISLPFLLAAHSAADMGSEMVDAADRTGIAVDSLSGLKFAAEQTGATLEDVEKATRKMSQNLVEAADGADGAADKFDKLGLSVDALKKLSPDKQFEAVIDALAKVENPTQRAAAALDIFGKGGAALLPLVAEGAGGIAKLTARARELGLIMSEEDARAAEAFGDQLEVLSAQKKKLTFQIGSAVIPALHAFLKATEGPIAATIKWLKENRGLIAGSAAVAAAILGVGTALIGLSGVIYAVSAAISFMGAAFVKAFTLAGAAAMFLLTPLGMITAAVLGFVALAISSTVGIGKFFSGLIDGAKEAAGIISSTFASIGDALASGQVENAGKVAIAGLKAAWLTGTLAIREAWANAVAFAQNVWDSLVVSIKAGTLKVIGFFRDMWEDFTAFAEIAGAKAFNTIVQNNPFASEDDKFKAQSISRTMIGEIETRQDENKRVGRLADQEKIDQMNEANRKAQDARAAGVQPQIDQARKDKQAALDELAALKQQIKDGVVVRSIKQDKPGFDDTLASANTSVAGTFSGTAAGMLGGGMAKDTKKTADNTAVIAAKVGEQLDLWKKGGLTGVFA